jgi:tocopherol O-methyltransferase
MDGFACAWDAPADEALMRSWLDGWAVPGLATPEEFHRHLSAAGFADVVYRDFTQAIRPSARRLYRLALPALWFDGIARRISLRTKMQSANARAARDQFRALQKSLWQYGQFLAIKPNR